MAIRTRLGTFQQGETLPVRRQTKDSAGALAAPTTLRFKVQEEGKSTLSFSLASSDSEIETLATGDYQLNFDLTTPGVCQVEVTAVVSGKTVIEHASAKVDEPNVT